MAFIKIKFVKASREDLKKFNFFKRGFVFGIIFGLFVTFVLPLFSNNCNCSYTDQVLYYGKYFPLYIFGGLTWGLLMKL